MKKVLFVIIVIVFLCICLFKDYKSRIKDVQIVSRCPPIVYLQPCNNFKETEAKKLVIPISKVLKEITDLDLIIEVLPSKILSDSLKNESNTRYRADKIIHSYPDNPHDAVILLTHDDISCSRAGKKDWGVLGFAIRPKHVCIASDFRLKDKNRDFWKVAIHELVHSFFNLPHCTNNDSSCIMQDARGHADLSHKNHLCASCKLKCHI